MGRRLEIHSARLGKPTLSRLPGQAYHNARYFSSNREHAGYAGVQKLQARESRVGLYSNGSANGHSGRVVRLRRIPARVSRRM